ncbi:MAG: hypothetical protein HC829_08050 [Bacteroidales bacterium]|nr:hypothetical protein [Bacteroidales bacterium]
MGDHPRLARARPGDDQQRSFGVDDGLALRSVRRDEDCAKRGPTVPRVASTRRRGRTARPGIASGAGIPGPERDRAGTVGTEDAAQHGIEREVVERVLGGEERRREVVVAIRDEHLEVRVRVQRLAQRAPKGRAPDVLYVSCDPPTLTRDLKILAEAGYRIDKVETFEMFPHTSHIETVTKLRIG